MSTTEPTPVETDVAALGYEDARAQLVEVVQRLEQGAATLEESMALWERGEALARRCQTWLDGARERLEKAAGREQGGPDSASPNRAGS